jgi:hypothetical protein
MNAISLPKVLFAVAGVFGVAATALGSWPSVVCAALAVFAATVEMFMRRVLFEERVMDLNATIHNIAKELGTELTQVKNDIIRLNNKNGIR